MAPNKRRKIESQDGKAPLVSAFAARKSLWGTPPDSPSIRAASQEPENGLIPQEETTQKEHAAAAEAKDILKAPVHDDTNGSGSPAQASSISQTPITRSAAQLQIASSDPPPRVVLQHSSFKPDRRNYQEKPNGRAILKLAEGERLVVLGSYGLKICKGEVTTTGATLRPDDPIQLVHAPHCHALPVLRATQDTTVELHPHPAAGTLRALERLSQVFGKLWNEDPQRSPGRSAKKPGVNAFQIIYTSDDGPKRAVLQDLVSPAEWNKKIAELAAARPSSPPVVVICGPKSSGKSTFGKLLANRFVTHQDPSRKRVWQGVAVLDLDPGQPEYSAPGTVSLVHVSNPNLAPSFCHPHPGPGNRMVRSHAIASVSPALDPEHFLECARDLLRHYRENLGSKSPLIVNTPGWIQGTGLDILLGLVENIRPTEVIYMSQDGPEETVEGLRAVCQDIPLCLLPSQESESTSRTALQFRTMQAMSYFHADNRSLQHHHSRWDPRPLADMPPWKVRFKGASPGFLGLLCYDYQPPPNLLVEAINGMVVGLAVIEQGAALRDLLARDSSAQGSTLDFGSNMELYDKVPAKPDIKSLSRDSLPRTPEGIPYIPNPNGRTLDPRYSRLAGLGLIRSIDVRRGELHLLTPLSDDIVAKLAKDGKNLVLVAGKFDTPSWAYIEDLYKRSFDSNAAGNVSHAAVEVADGDTDDDSSPGGYEDKVGSPGRDTESPWVELLHGNQKRAVGSQVWRVRRDLGRAGN